MTKLCRLLYQAALEVDSIEEYMRSIDCDSEAICEVYKNLVEDEIDHLTELIDIGDNMNFEDNDKIIWEFEKVSLERKYNKYLAKLRSL